MAGNGEEEAFTGERLFLFVTERFAKKNQRVFSQFRFQFLAHFTEFVMGRAQKEQNAYRNVQGVADALQRRKRDIPLVVFNQGQIGDRTFRKFG